MTHDHDRDVDAEQMTQHKPAHEAAMRNHTDQIVSTILDVMPLDREAYWEHAQMAADAIAALDKPVPPVASSRVAAIRAATRLLRSHGEDNDADALAQAISDRDERADVLAQRLAASDARIHPLTDYLADTFCGPDEASMAAYVQNIAEIILVARVRYTQRVEDMAHEYARAIARLDKPAPPVDGEHVAAIESSLQWMERLTGWDVATHLAFEDEVTSIRRHRDALAAQIAASEERVDELECQRNCLEQLVSHLRGIGSSNARDNDAFWQSVDKAYEAVYGDPPTEGEGEW